MVGLLEGFPQPGYPVPPPPPQAGPAPPGPPPTVIYNQAPASASPSEPKGSMNKGLLGGWCVLFS